ncbi:MAG: purine-nucleoside phosphorylase [Verrucomicrobia bacterium]|nr:MAG: purine-nucleoside phosphorylase [Verrucomicrobiota bacterium]
MDKHQLQKAADFVRQHWPAARPRVGLVLGSGWDAAGDFLHCRATLTYADIPGLGSSTVTGHSGLLHWCDAFGVETFMFQGRRHYYEGAGWTPLATPVYLLKQFSAQALVLTNAAGGIRADLQGGDLMVLNDHLNLMDGHPLIGPHDFFWGPRFPDLSRVYCPSLGKRLKRIFQTLEIPFREGVYAAMTGPTYETPAEVRMLRTLGADAVGMSTVPEAILAHAAGLRVAALSCIANPAAGLQAKEITHEDVIQTSREILPRLRGVLEQLWKELPDELGTTNPTA